MTDYEKLKSIIDDIDALIESKVTLSSPEFKAWHLKTERFLTRYFGDNSLEHKKFKDTKFTLTFVFGSTPKSEFIEKCKTDLISTKAMFQTYLEEMEEDINQNQTTQRNLGFDKVFIVHGHDGELKQAVARLVEKQNLTAVILSEQANRGKTIIEKFEEHSDVGGAICLFTADDFGHAKSEPDDQPRARQNVVFEAGYFMGKLGRDKVIIIAENGVELPSDMQGIVYTDKNNWELDVLKELRATGYTVDFNRIFQ